MPLQPIQINYPGLVQPLTHSISQMAGDVGQGVVNVANSIQRQKVLEANDQLNQATYNQLVGFFAPVKGLQVDWNSLQPMPNESNNDYTSRLKAASPTIIEQLNILGVDPKELQKAMATPGVVLDDVKKLIYKRTGTELMNELSNQILPPSTNAPQKPFSEMSEEEKNAWSVNGQPVPGYVPKAPAEVPVPMPQKSIVPQKNTTVAPAAPVAPAPAPETVPTPVPNQPLVPAVNVPSYTSSLVKVMKADIPSEQKGQYTPLLSTIANKQAVEIAKKPGMTEKGQMIGTMEQGVPLTPEGTMLVKTMGQEQNLAYKERYNEMRRQEQDNTLLKLLLSDAQFRAKMAKDYGKEGDLIAKDLFNKTQLRTGLNNQLEISLGIVPNNTDKEPPDPGTIISQMQQLDSEIERLKSKLPGFEQMSEGFKNRPTGLLYPQTNQPYHSELPSPPPSGTGSARSAKFRIIKVTEKNKK